MNFPILLDRFYRAGRRRALPTQLFFLLYRAQQIASLRNDLVGSVLVSDFLMEKHRLFAKLTLDEKELKLYDQILQNLDIEAPEPDLVIYLQVPVLLDRIRRRGIGFEQHIDTEYLMNLCSAYTRFFHYYDRARLLISERGRNRLRRQRQALRRPSRATDTHGRRPPILQSQPNTVVSMVL